MYILVLLNQVFLHSNIAFFDIFHGIKIQKYSIMSSGPIVITKGDI